MKLKRRETEIFSLSFLDCICCGFGAVLLLFVLTIGKKAETRFKLLTQIEAVVGDRENTVAKKDKELEDLRRSLSIQRNRNKELDTVVEEKKKLKTELDEELALLLKQLTIMEEALEKLMREKNEIPKVDEKPPIPIPNEIRRQYLTGFKIHGDHILFLVEASGGMLDDTVAKSIERLGDSDEEKRKAPKWSRVKKGVEWLIANLKPDSRYKIVFFNNEITPVESDYGQDWFDPSNEQVTLDVLEALDEVIPEEGANLERAFDLVDELEIIPDRIVLIVDGLPTLADSFKTDSVKTDADRINMFRAARKALDVEVPVNTILYPMENDPAAAVQYWRMSDDMGGAMVCPSPDWPNT